MENADSGGRDGPAINRLRTTAIAVVLILLSVRLFCAANVELLPEEAYYWTYSKHPALSYFDHPPMVAWAIWLGTTWLGDTELGVRILTIAFSVGSCVLLFLTSRVWFGERAALWSMLLFSAIPIFVGTGFLAFPDGPLIFFWLATMCALTCAFRTGRTGYWLLAGVAFGCALLSKYTAVLLGASLLLFLVFSREHRYWLGKPQPWLASVLALAVFAPVIFWNAQHHWESFLFQSTRTVGQRHDTLRDVGEFWMMQFAMLTPFVFALFGVTLWRAVKRGWLGRDDKWNFVAAFSLPLFSLFALASLKTRTHVNWSAPAFLALTLGAARIFLDGIGDPSSRRARRWRLMGWTTAGVCALVVVVGMSSFLWGSPKVFASSHVGGWRQLAVVIEETESALEKSTGKEPFILGADKYNLAAEICFYTREPEEVVNLLALGSHGLGFRFWTDLGKFEGQPAVAVLLKTNGEAMARMGAHFDTVDAPRRVAVPGIGERVRSVYLVNCYGYHWERAEIAAKQLSDENVSRRDFQGN